MSGRGAENYPRIYELIDDRLRQWNAYFHAGIIMHLSCPVTCIISRKLSEVYYYPVSERVRKILSA